MTIRKVNDWLLFSNKETSQSHENMGLAIASGPINIDCSAMLSVGLDLKICFPNNDKLFMPNV